LNYSKTKPSKIGEGLKLRAKLKAFEKNGDNLRDVEWCKKRKNNDESYKVTKKEIKEAVKRVKTYTKEKINNITLLKMIKVNDIS